MSLEMELMDPFKKRKKFEGIFDDFFEPMKIETKFSGLRMPLVDIIDNGTSLEIKAELPGANRKDIDLNITENSIGIRSESRLEKRETGKKGYYFHERKYSGFFRQLPLPGTVIPEKAKADFKDGILTINVPKREMPKEHKKNVKVKVQ